MDQNASAAVRSVVVADDHPIARRGVISVLGDIPNTQIVAEVADGLTAITAVKQHQPTLLVLDAGMPEARGIEVFAEARRWSPDTLTVLCTGFTSAGILAHWLDAGVDGMLLKTSEPEEMRRCFETVLAGGNFIASEPQRILDASTTQVSLTDREREVLSLIAMGFQSNQMADRLSISARTVEKHRASLMAKVGVGSVAQLIAHALKEGWLDEHRQS